jgi:hypothetical protein
MLSLEQSVERLNEKTDDVWRKYEALFCLRTIGTEDAAQVMMDYYDTFGSSELLKHEVMYVIGQMRPMNCFNFLIEKLNDESEMAIVRHEAGEALANYYQHKERCTTEMLKHWDSEISILRSTVRVGIQKLKVLSADSRFGKKYGGTIEPAEPFTEQEVTDYLNNTVWEGGDETEGLPLLERIKIKLSLPCSTVDEYSKYRICYYLRDLCTKESKQILASLFDHEKRQVISPLLRHELSFILGQIYQGEPFLYEVLRAVCADETEDVIARHEAILGFYDLMKDQELLQMLKSHQDQLIRESALCAIHFNY